VLVRIRDRGHGKVVRKLVGLTIEGDTVPAAGAAIVGGEKEIGRVTSAVMSPALDRPIALGYVHRDFVEPGTSVAVVTADATVGATVTEMPFIHG
jgi:glycine cleavage system aminomethyltransferase T